MPKPTPWSVASWLHALLQNAHAHAWSDIHIDAKEDHWEVRARQRQRLRHLETLSPNQGLAIMACLKVQAKLNITEHRRFQEGRMDFHHQSQRIACRVTTCPTLWGEKCAIRLLHHQQPRLLDALGMTHGTLQWFQQALSQHDGMIVICGPTGSGKSNTMAAAMQHLGQTRHVISLEDPVEIPMHHTTQIPLYPAIGLDYARALKGCLRLDPDVIGIGEIRDAPTAQLAIHAAQTGHLILCTIHSRDAPGVLDRLHQLGVKKELATTLIHGVLAQRMSSTDTLEDHPQFSHWEP